MKYAGYILLLAQMLFGCRRSDTLLQERLSGADSIAINYFKGDGSMDTVVAVRIIRDSPMVRQITQLITDKQSEEKHHCGYDGSLHFFRMNQVVQDVDFSFRSDDCMQFTYVLQGTRRASTLSLATKKTIVSLKPTEVPGSKH